MGMVVLVRRPRTGVRRAHTAVRTAVHTVHAAANTAIHTAVHGVLVHTVDDTVFHTEHLLRLLL